MNDLTSQEKLAAIKKIARHVTTEEIVQRGLEVLDATGLPLEGIEKLARNVGLELEDVAHTVGQRNGSPRRPSPIQIEADLVRFISEIHEAVVQRQYDCLASLSDVERDVYDTASKQEATSAIAEKIDESGCQKQLRKLGKPGRPPTMTDVADFANERRHLMWKENFEEWNKLHPHDNRHITFENFTEAWRRKYGDKANKRYD